MASDFMEKFAIQLEQSFRAAVDKLIEKWKEYDVPNQEGVGRPPVEDLQRPQDSGDINIKG